MSDKVGPKNWRRPVLLRPDNFTPPERTPWGGHRIVRELKRGLGLTRSEVVGESWELSVEPDFPSRLVEGPNLDDVLRADPLAWLGEESSQGSTALLVKLLDAADELSVQIHPDDSDRALDASESGKPEAWYIVDAEPDAGLYLGFRDGASRDDVRQAISDGDDVGALLHFVPVSIGDAFVIEPGTPHAIGRGVMLVEPQRVAPKKRGVTYRYWDWNRRYAADGTPDPSGAPRALHVERALEVTRWQGPREDALLDAIRHRSGTPKIDGLATLETLISTRGPLRSEVFKMDRLTGTGNVALGATDRIRALTVLDGYLALEGPDFSLSVSRGQTAALPAALPTLSVILDRAHAIVCSLA